MLKYLDILNLYGLVLFGISNSFMKCDIKISLDLNPYSLVLLGISNSFMKCDIKMSLDLVHFSNFSYVSNVIES